MLTACSPRLILAALLCAGLCPAGVVRANMQRPHNAAGKPPEMWLSSVELIERRGYPVETHEVRTADGYLLTIHRIPRPAAAARAANGTARHHGTPVLFGHGMGSNDEQWLLRAEDNLTFLIVDRGFDVWLANYRGSFYGRRHVTLDPNSRKFWDFSWHENAVFDQAAMIDYVLAVSGRPALLTLGHSMGCTVQLVLLAERPEFEAKVLGNVLLAPPVYFKYPTGLAEACRVAYKHFPQYHMATSTHLVNGQWPLFEKPAPLACFQSGPSHVPTPLCKFAVELSMGKPVDPQDFQLLELFTAHFPSGASVRQVYHYLQSIMTDGLFRLYDFGAAKNQQLYGYNEPPPYNLSRVKSPMYMYYSQTDNLVNYRDVENLAKTLRSLRRTYRVPIEPFNHIDYMLSRNAYNVIYKHVLEDLERHV